MCPQCRLSCVLVHGAFRTHCNLLCSPVHYHKTLKVAGRVYLLPTSIRNQLLLYGCTGALFTVNIKDNIILTNQHAIEPSEHVAIEKSNFNFEYSPSKQLA